MKLYRIKKSGIDKKGRGLYATRDIKEGTKIIDYVGKLITKKQTDESDKYDNIISTPRYFTFSEFGGGPFVFNNSFWQEGCTTSKKSDKFGIEIGIEVGMTWGSVLKSVKRGASPPHRF